MMFCTKCGKEMSDDAVFCSHCGAKNSNVKDTEESKKDVKDESHKKVIEVPIKRPFMKFLYSVALPLGIGLLLYACAMFIGVTYDKEEIRSFSDEYWEIYQENAKRASGTWGMYGVEKWGDLSNLHEEHHYIFFNLETFREKAADAKNKESFIRSVSGFYMESLYVGPTLAGGIVACLIGIVCGLAYKTAQKEEEEKIRG